MARHHTRQKPQTPSTLGRVPLVALVGRPNVGKSTLFNRLTQTRDALVHDEPGVTRDRLYGSIQHAGRIVRVVDTGGLGYFREEELWSGVRAQTLVAIEEADLVIMVADSVVGLVAEDRDVAMLLRKSGKLKAIVANKVDVPSHFDRVHEMYELGPSQVFGVSAEHDQGIDDLLDWVFKEIQAPETVEVEEQLGPLKVAEEPDDTAERPPSTIEWPGGPVRIAVIGRPNVGKSSLVNSLLGEERFVASSVAGTTRDAIDAELQHDNQTYILVDTAGIRRQRSLTEKLEQLSALVARRALERADVVAVVLDVKENVADQDAKLVSMALELGKGIMLVANKWDLLTREEDSKAWVDELMRQLPFAKYVPLLRVSAKTGRGVGRVLNMALEVQKERHRRVATSELNRFFKDVVENHPPPVFRGKRPRLYYVSQPLIRPPTFIFAASKPEAMATSYSRYLQNALRERYGFRGTPIWVKFRGHRKQADASK